MNNLIRLKMLCFFIMGILISCISNFNSFAQKIAQKPNIVVIMADDMGYSDIGCFGSEIATPNLDKLAADGLRLSQFYNAARCCPTRASLLTGLYPHMAGMGWMTGYDMKQPGYPGDLNNQCVTIAQVLKPAGYDTYATGKWHISTNTRYNGPKHNWPLQRGFDKYFGIIPGAANYFEPAGLTVGNSAVRAGKDFYLTDAISDTSVSYIKQQAAKKNGAPFFMYVAYNSTTLAASCKRKRYKEISW